jgi:DNA-binding transcriptional ArsR family regulator
VTERPPDLDPRLLKAIAHPLRHRLLAALDGRVASPAELAREFDVPLGRVSHHIRALAASGAIELVRTQQRRGAVEHLYRAAMRAWFTDEDWARIPLSTRRAIFASLLERIACDVAAASSSDGFGHPQAHVSYTRLNLDEAATDAVASILEETLERVLDANAECARAGDGQSPAPRVRAELAMLLFEAKDAGG